MEDSALHTALYYDIYTYLYIYIHIRVVVLLNDYCTFFLLFCILIALAHGLLLFRDIG